MENIQVGAGQLVIFTEAFSTICRTGFREYQMSSLIWVIGHLATGGHAFKSNMPKANYMKLKVSLAEARAKAAFLCTQMFQKGCTVSPAEFQKILDELTQVLAHIRYKENLFKKLEKEGRQTSP